MPATWETVVARSWWWPDMFFTSAAAEAAVSQAAAAEAALTAADEELPDAGRPRSAAAQRLAAQAVVAAFVEPPCSGAGGIGIRESAAGGKSFPAVVARVCRRQASLAQIAEQASMPGLPQYAGCCSWTLFIRRALGY